MITTNRSTERILVLVDEANVNGAARNFGRRVDWQKLRGYLADPTEGRDLLEMAVYVGVPPLMEAFQEQREGKERFCHWLRMNGFLVNTKVGSPTENQHYRANVDVLMAIDAMALATEMRPTTIVLVTGDADFAHLAHTLRRHGIRVEVAAVAQTLGNDLKAAANGVIDLQPLFNSFDGLAGQQIAPIGGNAIFDAAL